MQRQVERIVADNDMLHVRVVGDNAQAVVRRVSDNGNVKMPVLYASPWCVEDLHPTLAQRAPSAHGLI
jgi:hypothetical protein